MNRETFINEVMNKHRELEDHLSSTVKISHHEVTKLVVKDLISKRNSCLERISDKEWVPIFDKILRYYITEDEFTKYVINNKRIK